MSKGNHAFKETEVARAIRAVISLEIETTRVHREVLALECRTMQAITRFFAKTGRSGP